MQQYSEDCKAKTENRRDHQDKRIGERKSGSIEYKNKWENEKRTLGQK